MLTCKQQLRHYYKVNITKKFSKVESAGLGRAEGKTVGQNCKGDEEQWRVAWEPQPDQLKKADTTNR